MLGKPFLNPLGIYSGLGAEALDGAGVDSSLGDLGASGRGEESCSIGWREKKVKGKAEVEAVIPLTYCYGLP